MEVCAGWFTVNHSRLAFENGSRGAIVGGVDLSSEVFQTLLQTAGVSHRIDLPWYIKRYAIPALSLIEIRGRDHHR